MPQSTNGQYCLSLALKLGFATFVPRKELALYWLIHTESANLRHAPELLWFLFFCAQQSSEAEQVMRPETAAAQFHAQAYSSKITNVLRDFADRVKAACGGVSDNCDGGGGGSAVAAGGGSLLARAAVALHRAHRCGERPIGPTAAAAAALPAAAATPSAYELLLLEILAALPPRASSEGASDLDVIQSSLASYNRHGVGMGSPYLVKVVQPLFHFLAEQVYLLGKQRKAEAAVRVAYDDVTESMASPDVVSGLLTVLIGREGLSDAKLWGRLLLLLGQEAACL
ncbi:hypothetical protein GPECTOR_163g142 [Gonium pectorale]|uniref:Uncharacterized protein n=1 Tax=Gonium pectorale TaxID=33097 RepID=A0A150FXG1_GONPE|nr:hypothetical protein GPECTOR_163g142 [Gonium pectorale]|eukprot:KXZ42314.1 hypothetical protein GPECTOR_163g142 [Gonium pectorale]